MTIVYKKIKKSKLIRFSELNVGDVIRCEVIENVADTKNITKEGAKA